MNQFQFGERVLLVNLSRLTCKMIYVMGLSDMFDYSIMNENSGKGKGLLENRIIFNSNNNNLKLSGECIFESSSSLAENQKSFFSGFFDLFEGVNDVNMCPLNTTEYATCLAFLFRRAEADFAVPIFQ